MLTSTNSMLQSSWISSGDTAGEDLARGSPSRQRSTALEGSITAAIESSVSRLESTSCTNRDEALKGLQELERIEHQVLIASREAFASCRPESTLHPEASRDATRGEREAEQTKGRAKGTRLEATYWQTLAKARIVASDFEGESFFPFSRSSQSRTELGGLELGKFAGPTDDTIRANLDLVEKSLSSEPRFFFSHSFEETLEQAEPRMAYCRFDSLRVAVRDKSRSASRVQLARVTRGALVALGRGLDR